MVAISLLPLACGGYLFHDDLNHSDFGDKSGKEASKHGLSCGTSQANTQAIP